MKKIIVAVAICAASFGLFGDTVTNVYNLTMSLKTPTLYAGVRTPTGQTYKGYLYAEYTDNELTALFADVTSSKTKVQHLIEFDLGESFYHLMGKTTKQADRSVPSLFLTGADTDAIGWSPKYEQHETIKKITLSGFGTLKTFKTAAIGCGACGFGGTAASYCNLLWSGSGTVTGYMDCECPDTEPWWHTVRTVLCGVWYDDVTQEVERRHEGAFQGTWKITYNKKLSDVK
jgi:hypothetical protein